MSVKEEVFTLKFVMTQAICPEGMELLDEDIEVYVADDPV